MKHALKSQQRPVNVPSRQKVNLDVLPGYFWLTRLNSRSATVASSEITPDKLALGPEMKEGTSLCDLKRFAKSARLTGQKNYT